MTDSFIPNLLMVIGVLALVVMAFAHTKTEKGKRAKIVGWVVGGLFLSVGVVWKGIIIFEPKQKY